MSLLIALIIGVLVGISVDFLMHGAIYNLLLNSMIGIAGSIIGLAIYFFFFNFAQNSIALFSVQSALCSVIVALIATLLVDGLQAITPKRASHQTHIEEDPIDED
jgi:uncharacterized membrane protein YeaQ/YmgE (transglycosylase-associated protein family)